MFGDETNHPDNICYEKLGDIATYINGAAFKPSDWGTEGLPIVRIQNLSGTGEAYNYYNGNYKPEVEITDGDILISWSATLGVYLWDKGKALLNQHIFKVLFNKKPIDKYFFIYAVQQKLESMKDKTHGSTMTHIVKKDFDNTKIAYPSPTDQSKFANIVKQADKSKFQISKLINLIPKTIEP